MATVNDLAPQVFDRVEELPGNPIFYTTVEARSAIIEACNEMMLLVGRPTQTVNVLVTIQPNSWLQSMPPGVFAITDIYSNTGEVYKYTLFDMDYALISWGADWEMDIGTTIQQWFPVGLNKFGVHPAVSAPQTVTVTGIAYVTTDTWPYSGNENIPFSDEFFSAIEAYAAGYLLLKDGGDEMWYGVELFKRFLAQAQRMTQIQDVRDPYIFSQSLGSSVKVSPVTAR